MRSLPRGFSSKSSPANTRHCAAMPPFQSNSILPQPQPRYEAKQDADSDGYQITLEITRLTTTYTTTISLIPSTPFSALVAAASTTISPATPPQPSHHTDNTPTIVGAVLGSILGIMVLITLFYKCCIDNRSAAWIPARSTFYDDSDSDASSTSTLSVGRRGGGGDGFSRHNRHGDRVRRPARVRTRATRSDASRSDTSRSERSGRRPAYGTRGMMPSGKGGLMGFFMVPPRRSYRPGRSSTTRYARTGTRYYGDD